MISRVVEMVLRKYPKTRDSDKQLLIKVWEHCGLYLSEAQIDKFYQIAPPETIRRIRQKIQEEGRYLPTSEKIAQVRRLKGMITQQRMPKTKSSKVDNVLGLDVKPLRKYYG